MKNKKFIPLILGALFTLNLASCGEIIESSLSSINQQQKYSISYIDSDYCDISLNKLEATRNEIIEVSISNIVSGYRLQKITANDMKIDGYSFIMPNEDVVVKTYFEVVNEEVVPPVVVDDTHKVTIFGSEYAVISTNYEKCLPDTQVSITYACKGNYVLDYFTVNDEKIIGTTFVMPDSDVVIKGYFIDAIGNTEDQTYCYAGGVLSKAYWYFTFDNDFLNIKVKVIDRFVCGREFKSDIGYRDNIEFVLSKKTTSTTFETDKTWKILVSCDNNYFLQKANSATTWGSPLSYSYSYFYTETHLKSLNNGDGYDGYEVQVKFNYSLLGLTKDQALNNISIGMAMRNTIDSQATNWNHDRRDGFIFENPSTHPILMSDGFLK